MEYNKDKVDEMALALLYLTSFREKKEYPLMAWKGMDWDILDRLHEKGLIGDAKNKNKCKRSRDFKQKRGGASRPMDLRYRLG
jgi:hypothetical protein